MAVKEAAVPAPSRTGGQISGELPIRRDRPLTVEEAFRFRVAAHQKRIDAGRCAGYDRLGARFEALDALDMDRRADATLDLPPGTVAVGRGGEALPLDTQDMTAFYLRDTLTDSPDAVAARASLSRLELLEKSGTLALAVDTAETVQLRNSVERMLAHQLASPHVLMMRATAKATSWLSRANPDDSDPARAAHASIESARLMNAAARRASAFNDGAATLQRLRSGRTQRVVVQHVNVTDGGQAVVAGGDVAGGRRRRGSNAK